MASSSLFTKTKRISSSLLLPRLLRLHFSTQTNHKKDDIPFVAQYLVSSFGFSMDRALKLSSSSSHLSPIKSRDQPESVVQFLKKTGLSDPEIKTLISFQPILLSSNVERTLNPRASELMNAGFGEETLVQLIRFNPMVLSMKDTLKRMNYWREFVGNKDEILLKIIKRNGLMICQDLNARWFPKLNLLTEYGLSQEDIIKILLKGRRFMLQNVDSIKQILEKTEELGFKPGSGMFRHALQIVGSYKKESWDKKMEFYKNTFGWTEEQILGMFKKFPTFFGLSDEKLKMKMDFLVKVAGIDPENLILHPILLGRSLEKCLVPRYKVLSILNERRLGKNYSLFHVCGLKEEKFVEKFVNPYEKMVPELAKTYRKAYGAKKL